MVAILPTKNLAPSKPLFDLANKEKTAPSYITDGLKELRADLLKRDEPAFKEIIATTEITSNFAQGKQLFTPTSNGWRIQNIRRVDPNKITAINVMQYFLTQNIEQFCATDPDVEPSEFFRQIEYKEKVKKAAAVWNTHERKFYKPWFNQQEALHCVLSGTYIESVQYDHFAQGSMAYREMWGEVSVPISEGKGQCFSCNHDSDDADFMPEEGMPQCPECGSFDIDVQPPVTQMMPSVTGLQPIQMGGLNLRVIPIQATRFDIRRRAEESSYLIERIKISKNRLEMILGAKLDLGEAEMDKGLQSLDAIQRAGNTLYGQESNRQVAFAEKYETVIDRISLSVEDYAHIKNLRPEQTVSGEEIPVGASLKDLCPEGMTALFANEGKVLLGIWPGVHHSDEVTSGVYHMRLESGAGRGGEDQVEVQKRFNRNDAQMLKAGETGATPAHFFVEGSVDRKFIKQIGHPDTAVPIKREIVEALGTTELIRQIPPASVAGTFFQYTYELLDKYRQMTAHAPDLSNSLLGAKSGGTATEARISDSNAERLSSPLREMKGDVRVGTAQKTLQLYHKHFQGVSQWHSYGTTKNQVSVGEQIKGEDIDPNIEFVIVKDSTQPKTRYSQQSGWAASSQVIAQFGGMEILQQTHPDLIHEIFQSFGVDTAADDYDTTEDLCWRRLQQAIQMAGQPPEVILMSIKPMITPFEPYHPQKMQWLSEYLDTPPGVELDEMQRQSLFVLIDAHRNGGMWQQGMLMQAEAGAQVIGSEPVREAQAQDQAMQAEQQQQMEMQKGEQEHARNMEAQVAGQPDPAEAEDAREHEVMMKGLDLANAEAERRSAASLADKQLQAAKASKAKAAKK